MIMNDIKECGEEENELFREMIDDRLQRGADAACTALIAITANKMPKTVHLHSNSFGHRKLIPPLIFPSFILMTIH